MILGALFAIVVAAAVFGMGSGALAVVSAVAIVVMLVVDRFWLPVIDRWARGATGEEEVGRLLTQLGDGWVAEHDIATGRGNIDHVVIGPAGLFTIETKSHGGRRSVEQIDEGMLKQAYAQRKWLERAVGEHADALLVFTRAYLDPAIARRRGVLVLPGRMLVGHLRRRPARLGPDDVAALHARLVRQLI
jgi:hypothetical protein